MDDPVQCYRISSNFRMLGRLPIEDVELYLTVCGTERCTPDKFYGPIVRRDYHVHFILSGGGTLEMDGKVFRPHRGQIFVTVPGVNLFYYSDPEDPWHYAWISFNGSKAALYLEKAGLTAEHPVRDCYLDPEEFLGIIEEILNHHEITVANELTRTALLYQILALLVNSQNQNLEKQNKPLPHDYSPDVYVDNALAYIHNHYTDAKVSDIASYIGITRSYLTHIFKQRMEISPQEYLLSYRLEQGSRLLRTTGMSIQEIAEAIGYENPLTFSKMFKNVYGMSPKYYRQKVLEKESSMKVCCDECKKESL